MVDCECVRSYGVWESEGNSNIPKITINENASNMSSVYLCGSGTTHTAMEKIKSNEMINSTE